MDKQCNKCKFIKSVEFFHKDSSSKDGFHTLCKECKNASRRAWKKNNILKNRKSSNSYYKRNAEVYKKAAKKWRKLNPGKTNFMTAKRRSWIKRATPSWANLEKIMQIYMQCPKGYHVDHIIPLRGKDICGLHIESNLQYLPASENIKKGNRYVK